MVTRGSVAAENPAPAGAVQGISSSLPDGVVGERVDWLQLRGWYDFDEGASSWDVLDEAYRQSWSSREAVPVRIHFGRGRELVFEVRATKGAHRVSVRNPFVRGVVWLSGAGAAKQNFEFESTQYVLAGAGYHEALDWLRLAIWSVGRPRWLDIQRVDLAVDFEDWDFTVADVPNFIRKGRTAVEYRPFTSDEIRVWPANLGYKLGTIEFGRRSSKSPHARIYQKSAHLKHKASDTMREIEHDIWSRNGWRGGDVTRLEFELGAGALKSMGIEGVVFPEYPDDFVALRSGRWAIDDGLGDLRERLAPVWRYLVDRWVRLIDPSSNQVRTRCASDPRWRRVQAVEWAGVHCGATKRVTSKPGGATDAQALGVLLSALGSSGALGDGVESAAQLADLVRTMFDGRDDEVRRKAAAAGARFGSGFVDGDDA